MFDPHKNVVTTHLMLIHVLYEFNQVWNFYFPIWSYVNKSLKIPKR